jgi:hypothetical protein
LLDKQNQFSADAGDTPTAVGSTVSTNVIDLGVARDIGGAVTDKLYLLCQVITAFASGGAATLKVQYQGSTDNVTFTTIVQSDDVAVASLIAGYKFLQNEAPSVPTSTLYRYHRLNYVIGTAVMTAGALRSAFVPGLQHAPTYQNAYVA